MAPPKSTTKPKVAKDKLASQEGGVVNLKQLRLNELAVEFRRQERELAKIMRKLGAKLTNK